MKRLQKINFLPFLFNKKNGKKAAMSLVSLLAVLGQSFAQDPINTTTTVPAVSQKPVSKNDVTTLAFEEVEKEELTNNLATAAQEAVASPEEINLTEQASVIIPDIALNENNSAPIPQHPNYQNQYIPVIENAHVFANLTDALPAVINYFTQASEDEIINFYQNHFGEALSQERMRGRLTIRYQQNQQYMRVVISTQGSKRQVDVLVSQ